LAPPRIVAGLLETDAFGVGAAVERAGRGFVINSDLKLPVIALDDKRRRRDDGQPFPFINGHAAVHVAASRAAIDASMKASISAST
jgi:hypothetical protein